MHDEPSNPRVRRAEPPDIPTLALLTGELGYGGFGRAAYEETVAALLARGDHRMWVAELDARAVGYAVAHLHLRPGLAGPMVSFDELVVGSDARGRGVGSALVAAVEAFAAEQRAARLELITARDRDSYRAAFYANRGFAEVDSAVLRKRIPHVGSAPSRRALTGAP